MNATQLKELYYQHNPSGHFFDHETMKFFGDTMKNYGVCESVIRSQYDEDGNYHTDGVEIEVYELFRRKPVKHNVFSSAYFGKRNVDQVFKIK